MYQINVHDSEYLLLRTEKETILTPSITLKNILYLLITVILLSLGQVLVKAGIQRANLPANAGFVSSILPLFLKPLVIAGLIATASSTAFYFTVLSEVNLSIAYPMISLSYIIVLALSSVLFNESISKIQIAGILAILLGIFLLSRPH